jgi:hypothetical protein
MPEIPNALRSAYQQGRLITFVGAGASMSVNWVDGGTPKRGPSWRELVDEAARRLGFAVPDLLRVRGTDLQILEYFYLKEHSFGGLTHWMYAEMRPPDDNLAQSPIHHALAQLINCRLFYTTNYDDFLERSFALHGRAFRKVAIEQHMGFGGDGCEILKFHGDLDFPDDMVLSESHYERRLTLSTPMDFRLKGDMLGRVLLFIGYSFRDWNVAYLFRLVNEMFGDLPGALDEPRAYILVSNPSEFERKLFGARNMDVVSIGSDPTSDVAAVLRGLL